MSDYDSRSFSAEEKYATHLEPGDLLIGVISPTLELPVMLVGVATPVENVQRVEDDKGRR